MHHAFPPGSAHLPRLFSTSAHSYILRKSASGFRDGGPNHWEIWLRDLDGYKVVLASPDGTADGEWRP
jgi:hypothetical protein